jgi:hypothetical protein
MCPGCSGEVPSDAVLCPHCGRELVESEPVMEEPSLRSILSPRFFQIQAIAFFVWCLVCAFCSLASFFLGVQSIPWLSPEYRPVPEQATFGRPTSTPAPANGQSPVPTPTLPAIAPSYWEIEENMKAMAETEWDGYVDEIEGTWASNWIGWVEDVHKTSSGGYELRIDVDSPDVIFSGRNITFDIADEMAAQVKKDQQITFSGRIESVTNVLGSLQIRLQDAEWSIDDE